MGLRAGGRVGIGVAIVALAAAFWAPAVGAQQIIGPQDPDDPQVDSPWQAGTCTTDSPTCSVATDEQFFEQAAGHPPVGFTQFIVNTEPGTLGPVPIGNLRTVRVDIPPGLTVNPQATPKCELAPEESPSACATRQPDSKVGTSTITAISAALLLDGTSVTLPTVDVFNIVPEQGEPARFGFSVLGNDVFLETDIEWEGDYHQYFTIHAHKLELPLELGLGDVARIAKNRLVFDGRSGNGTFITTPTTCLGGSTPGQPHVYSTYLRADSYEDPDPNFPHGSAFVEAKIPPGTSPKECGSIPFDPSLGVNPNTAQTDSPSGAAVEVALPEIQDPGKQATSQVRSAQLTLPPGMGLNPSAAHGLVACTDAQFGKGTRNPVACPAASRVGTVEVDTPPLPDGSLSGAVYVGQQLSRDPASGDLYRIFIAVGSARFDISARLLGKVIANPVTGQLTNVIDDAPLGKVPIPGLPQVPFKSFRFKFDGGPHAPLTSPPTCGPNTATTQMTPWSGNPPVSRSTGFSLASLPGGGPCPPTLAQRPFGPAYSAGTDRSRAKTFSPLRLGIDRADGNQELKGVDITLPPGLTAKLAGVSYCPEAVLAAASARAGHAEAAAPGCPGSSLIGGARIATGSGPTPIAISGRAYLAGPYKGAPLSMAVLTPATAGPYDLGTVLVRVALHVDPRTAQVRAISDPIPHVYGGAQLSIRSVAVGIDRPGFTLNPTSCKPMAIGGTLAGGGADPVNPAAFAPVGVSNPYQASECRRLGFKPRLFLRLFGATRRAQNPKLRAVLQARKGDANIGRAAVTLPRSLYLDQSSISKVCTRVQFAARACPKNSVYGHARAFSPLIGRPLRGPVYLRSSDNTLPDLVADLRGQVNIALAGRTDAVRGRIRNTFEVVPDVPVTKFILTLRGGRKGLLVNSRNLCPRKAQGKRARLQTRQALVRFRAHNSRKANRKQNLRVPCGKGARRGGQRSTGGR